MSWTDPCSNCSSHRADCDCGDWNGYEKKKLAKRREGGYYSVKQQDNWTIAHWDNEGGEYGWHIIGNNNEYNDNFFQEIGDKIELPKD
jgi:hypothetical protein